MKISLVQPDTVWENKAENFRILKKLILPLSNKTDIVVLPEMFNTGFSMNPEFLGESPRTDTFDWMKSMAVEGNFGLCGSYMVRENGLYYNRFVFVSPGNEVWQYDKRHLFSMSGENKFFTPGNQRVTFRFRDIRISPFICYDLRFPVWSRNRDDTDLIIYSANWPESRKLVWNTLIKSRAIENQCYVAAVNRTGTDGNGVLYCGESMLINYQGEVIAGADSSQESIVTGETSVDELLAFRTKYPFLKDADEFSIYS
jgi:predicted amidohydrolase